MIYLGNDISQQHSKVATDESTWPEYTHIGRLPPNNTIVLKYQGIELKLVIRKAMGLIEGRVRFRDAFPPLPKRVKWNRECLGKACDGLTNSSVENAKKRYMMIQKRLNNDERYFKEVSSLVHISTLAPGCS